MFMGIGLLAAAVIGFGVWRASTPSTLSPTDTAMTGTTSSTISASTSEGLPSQVTEETTEEQQSLEVAPIQTDDPYLPPHAHIPAPGQETTTTRTYRPANPFETEASSLEPTELSTELPTGMGSGPTEPVETTEPTEPTESPTQEPTQPTVPTTEPTSEPTTDLTTDPMTEPTTVTPSAGPEITLTPQAPAPVTSTPTETAEIQPPAETEAPTEIEEPTETETPAEVPEETTQRAEPPRWGSWFS